MTELSKKQIYTILGSEINFLNGIRAVIAADRALRKQLTLEQIEDAWAGASDPCSEEMSIYDFARTIERAHGIVEEGNSE